ncbi:MAG: RsmE family RNA methyltransferase [Actinomycetota bacterium]|nr:RsmE family RNA methyltransferase [Actinomycetota bacterium]MDD5665828.1 RsmE family RNA methyltransferase [Actinomycetota bacterium]
MTTARFYVSGQALSSGRLVLEGPEHHHASRVLRMRAGESIILMDGKGCIGRGTIESITPAGTSVVVNETSQAVEERPLLHLFQGIPGGSKMDGVVQGGVELGAASLQPFLAARSRRAHATYAGKVKRWRRIALEAARVAGRPFLPEVAEVRSWDEVLALLEGMDLALFADEAGGERPATALAGRNPGELALLVGPEGGLAEEERKSLAEAGALPVSLGSNILRTETAGMVLMAAVRCHYGLL